MKNLYWLLLGLIMCINLAAQNDGGNKISSIDDKNQKKSNFNIYADGGSDVAWNTGSVNLESRIASTKSNIFHFYGRAGVGLRFQGRQYATPRKNWAGIVALTILVGKNNHHFETNLGLFIGNDLPVGEFNHNYGYSIFEIGYRYQKPGNGLIIRTRVGTLGLGLSLGYAF